MNPPIPPELPSKRIAELIQTIKESADKLASDHTSRGDLKIISRTLRELRYAFKVFSPYRHSRKVTVFGSARTPARPAGLPAGRGVWPGDGRARLVRRSPARPAGSWRPATSAPAANTRWA